jgi:NCAIR mutase (PurE)-related protein
MTDPGKGLVPDEVNLDFGRRDRIGLPEHIFCAAKSVEQIDTILQQAFERQAPLLLTRLEESTRAQLALARHLDYEKSSKTAYFQWMEETPVRGRVAVVCAGTSDVPMARECLRTLRYHGEEAAFIVDVGVAGLHRLLARADELKRHRVVIAVAGMDAALISVVGGMVPGLVIGVPTSVGYGVAAGGTSALHAGLASCASGVVMVNVDNGYGAACAALRALRA